jgi:Lon protease-like protein
MKLALFPLNTVMFPGSILPLQIFEQRYLNLIKECMKQQTGFATVLISKGKEVGGTPQIYRIGCYVDIIDWDALPNGLLGINIQAKHRVRLSNSSVKDDGLLLAEANLIQSTLDNNPPLPEAFKPLPETLKQLLNHPFATHYKDKIDFNDTADVCYRLGELLPISNKQKQLLLESETTEQMLNQLALHINALQR